MSDTPKLPDEAKKLLDNDWYVVMFRSQLGSYTAVALNLRTHNDCHALHALDRTLEAIPENQITDDFEPSQALTRLAAKVYGVIL